jgi:hypothetical protein
MVAGLVRLCRKRGKLGFDGLLEKSGGSQHGLTISGNRVAALSGGLPSATVAGCRSLKLRPVAGTAVVGRDGGMVRTQVVETRPPMSRNLSRRITSACCIAIFFPRGLPPRLEDHIRTPRSLAKSVPPRSGSGARTARANGEWGRKTCLRCSTPLMPRSWT